MIKFFNFFTKPLLLLIALGLLTGCVTSQFPIAPISKGVDPLRKNPRIVFRDLTKPYSIETTKQKRNS
jgi:ethanolamine transporter EutH